ncbi:MAG TPA: PilZ domain-containing protein [Candidatus Acidoferrales bacterium]|nr:PilZ domain-containing protein [Candidatus Acidoferrales bacterium]
MTKQKRARSPRYSVPNNEQVLVSVDNEQLKGTLHLLSLTGGAVRLEKRFSSGTLGDIGINTVSGNVMAAIELLQMANGRAQAFRFIAMGPVARQRLTDALNKMRGQGLAVQKTALDQMRSFARQVVSRRFR